MSDKKPHVYFMTGRFQPFTLGHLKLFNEMLTRASARSPDADAYLFVSYKNPKFSLKSVVDMDDEVKKGLPSLNSLKKFAKAKDSILDNPLTTDTRLDFVKHLLQKIYGADFKGRETEKGSGIFEYSVSKILDIDAMFDAGDHLTGNISSAMTDLTRTVKLFLVNSRITETGGLKPYGYLKGIYRRNYAVKMVTGSDRKTSGYFENQNSPIERNETNTRANNASPSKLSGSKIRALCFLSKNPEHEDSALADLKTMYYNLLSEEEIKRELVDKINGEIQNYVSEKSKKTAKPKTVKSTTSRAKSTTAKTSATIKSIEALSPTRNSRTVRNNNASKRRSVRARKPVTYTQDEDASYGRSKSRRRSKKRKSKPKSN